MKKLIKLLGLLTVIAVVVAAVLGKVLDQNKPAAECENNIDDDELPEID